MILLNNETADRPKLKIGTTGHRDIDINEELNSAVDRAINEVLKTHRSKEITVISPLAEGADRIIYHRTKKIIGNTRLHALLPMEVRDYIEDFQTSDSKEEFLELLEESERIDIISIRTSTKKGTENYQDGDKEPSLREISYEACGHLMVDMCDVLIAIWDGEKARGRGGTAEVVEYARMKERPIVWINSGGKLISTFENFLDK